MYISFITDAYSRKIIGYHLADNLQTSETIQALQMAISNLSKESKEELSYKKSNYCKRIAGLKNIIVNLF